jgi:exodeoxyribonuclease-3
LVIAVYAPNGVSRPEYRHKEWDPDFLKFVRTIRENTPTKELIIIGDMNVSHQKDLDLLASSPHSQQDLLIPPKSNNKMDVEDGRKTEQEQQRRQNFSKLVSSVGLVDTFRHFYPQDKKFTCFSSRDRRRLDYALITNTMLPHLKDSKIMSSFQGSDHCPIELHLKGMMVKNMK